MRYKLIKNSLNKKYNITPKATQMKACVADSAIASEAKVVINAIPVATTFAQAQLSLMR